MTIVSRVCVCIRISDNDEILAFNQFLHKHIKKTNTVNTVYYIIKNQSTIACTLCDYR